MSEAATAMYRAMRENDRADKEASAQAQLRQIADAWNDYRTTGSTAILHQRIAEVVEGNDKLSAWSEATGLRNSEVEGEQHPFNDVLSPPSGICADCGKGETQHE